jgi:hypothetical protein
MKTGANRTDIIAIKKLADKGESAEFISGALQIDENVVKGFMSDKPKEKNKTGKSKSKLAESFSE